MRLLKHWTAYRTRRLATIALSEQLAETEAAFYAGAWAAVTEMVGVPRNYAGAPRHRDEAVDEMITEIETRRRERGEHA